MNTFETKHGDGSTVQVYDRSWTDGDLNRRDVVVIIRDAHNEIVASEIVKLPPVVKS